MIKRLFISILLCAVALCTSAQTGAGEKSLGPKLGYISENSSVVAGLVFRYSLTDHLTVVPEIGCAFRNKDRDAFLADVNFHFPFALTDSRKASLYPLAGLAFNSWNRHGVDEDNKDVTTHVNRFGLNLGAGFGLRCSQSLLLNMEAKYILVKSYSCTVLTLGVSYVF